MTPALSVFCKSSSKQKKTPSWKSNLTSEVLPVSTGVTEVMKPLWVLTGSVTGAAVVTTTGTVVVSGATVVAGKAGGTVVSGRAGGMVVR